MASKRRRGGLRILYGATWGYFTTTVVEPSTGEKKRKQHSVKLGPASLMKRDLKTAYKALDAHIEAAEDISGKHRPDAAVTLESFARARWLPTREPKWRSFTDAKGATSNPGKDAALYILQHIFDGLGKVRLEDLDSVMLQQWVNSMANRYSGSLVKKCRIYLKSILEWAVWEDYLRKNPAKYLSLPATRTVKKDTLSPEQFAAVLAQLKPRDRLLLETALFTAARPSELLALRWRDFNAEKCTLTLRETVVHGVLRPFTKTTEEGDQDKRFLRVQLPETMARELSEERGKVKDGHGTRLFSGQTDFIFGTKKGKTRTLSNIHQHIMRPVREKLGLPLLNFQVLRRTMATLAQHKGSLKDIQTHLRHKSPDMTATEYIQEIPESVKMMINAVHADVMKPKRIEKK